MGKHFFQVSFNYAADCSCAALLKTYSKTSPHLRVLSTYFQESFFFIGKPPAGVHGIWRLHHMHLIRSQSPGDLLIRCVLTNFAKFAEKRLCRSLLINKVADWKVTTLSKKMSSQALSCEFYKVFRNIYLVEYLAGTTFVGHLNTSTDAKHSKFRIWFP